MVVKQSLYHQGLLLRVLKVGKRQESSPCLEDVTVTGIQ